jgi:hypothetical protein
MTLPVPASPFHRCPLNRHLILSDKGAYRGLSGGASKLVRVLLLTLEADWLKREVWQQADLRGPQSAEARAPHLRKPHFSAGCQVPRRRDDFSGRVLLLVWVLPHQGTRDAEFGKS